MARQPVVEGILRENEVNFEFRERYPLNKVVRDPESESQVRQERDSAPPPEVKQYTAQLQAGADFPPILLRKSDGLLFDGNTRFESHVEGKREVIQAYLVDVESPKVMKRLSIAINQTQGKRCTRQDIINYLDSLNGAVVDPDQFIRDTGWTRTSLQKYLAVKECNQRLQDASITQKRKVDDAVKVHINTVRQVEPFVALYRLAEDAGLKAGEAKGLARKVKEAPSESDMLSLINAERECQRTRIEEIKAGIPAGPVVSGRIALYCGGLVAMGIAGLEDRNLTTRDKSREWLTKAQRVVSAALRRYDDEAGE